MATNRYCEHLGIPVPCLDEIIKHPKHMNLFYFMVIAIVEHGGPMTMSQIADRLLAAGYQPTSDNLELTLQRSWHGSPPVHKLADGTLDIDLHSHDLDFILLMAGARKPERSTVKDDESFAAWEAEQRAEAAKLRRAIVHGAWDDSHKGVFTILDIANHTLCTLSGDAMAEAAHFLSQYDLLAGLGIFDTIRHLGLETARWKLIDLASHQKSITINRQGRRQKITTAMLMRASTGRPLGDAAKLSQYLANNQMTKLIRRVESDAKALYVFYRYAVLHRALRVKWGFIEQVVPAYWGETGDMTLDGILKGSAQLGHPVDLIVGSAPGWADPWARAQRGIVAGIAEWDIMLFWETRRWVVGRYDVQAVRIVGEGSDS